MNLEEEFNRIKENHKNAIQTKVARIVVGPSVGRVFQEGTVYKIRPVLKQIKLKVLNSITSQEQYRKWFENQLNKLAAKIKETNPKNDKIYPGYKWGHSTKILCLFLNDVLIHRDFFDAKTSDYLIHFLYAPIDSFVMKRLNYLGIKLDFSKIKEIDTPKKFYNTQEELKRAADKVGVPRIWFDDNWGDRQ